MSLFGDPEFIYHQAAARMLGLLTMRIATADVAPLTFSSYGRALMDDLDDIRTDVAKRARVAGANAFAPDFAPIVAAIKKLDAAGKAADAASAKVAASGDAAAALKMSETLAHVCLGARSSHRGGQAPKSKSCCGGPLAGRMGSR